MSLTHSLLIMDYTPLRHKPPHYTWFGPAKKKSTLDWILVNKSWYETQLWTTHLLSRKNSDHRPIRLGTNNIDWGPKPFKYYNTWLEDPTLNLMISNINCTTTTTGDIQLRSVIRNICSAGKWWNKNVLGHLDITIINKEKE